MRAIIRPIIIIATFATLMMLLSACGLLQRSGNLGLDSADSGPRFAVDAQVYVVCSNECRQRAQCGTTTAENGAEVDFVLVNSVNPVTRDHGWWIQANETVTVLQTRVETMVTVSDGRSYDIPWYEVRYSTGAGDYDRNAWVHPLCVADRPN